MHAHIIIQLNNVSININDSCFSAESFIMVFTEFILNIVGAGSDYKIIYQ